MGTLAGLLGRAWRFVRQYGIARLCRKVKERRDRELAEKEYEAWLFRQLPDEEENLSGSGRRRFPSLR